MADGNDSVLCKAVIMQNKEFGVGPCAQLRAR